MCSFSVCSLPSSLSLAAPQLQALAMSGVMDIKGLGPALGAMTNLTSLDTVNSCVDLGCLPGSVTTLSCGPLWPSHAEEFSLYPGDAEATFLNLERLQRLEELRMYSAVLKLQHPAQLDLLYRLPKLRLLLLHNPYAQVDSSSTEIAINTAKMTQLTALEIFDGYGNEPPPLPPSLLHLSVEFAPMFGGDCYPLSIGASGLHLSTVPKLRELELVGVDLQGDLRQLEGLTALEYLDMSRSTNAAGINFAALAGTLRTLVLSGTGLTAADVALPATHITF